MWRFKVRQSWQEAEAPHLRIHRPQFTKPALRKSTGTRSKREADQLAGKWQQEIESGKYGIGKNISWDAFRLRYEDEVMPSLAAGTSKKIDGVLNTVERIVKPKRLADLTERALSYYHPLIQIPGEHENGHEDRESPMAPEFAELLRTTVRGRRAYVFNPTPMRPSVDRLGAQQVGRVVSAIGKRAGVIVNPKTGKFASAHDLRRSFGDRWSRKVMPAVLMALMRHSSIQTTMGYYVTQEVRSTAATLWEAARGEGTDTPVASVDEAFGSPFGSPQELTTPEAPYF